MKRIISLICILTLCISLSPVYLSVSADNGVSAGKRVSYSDAASSDNEYRAYLNKYGKEITLEQLAKELKTSKEDIAMALDSARPVNSIEDSQYRDNKTDKTISLIDQLSSGKDEENEITNRITIKKLISELKDNEKEVILLRYYKGKTQMQVAKILGITQVQVSRIERKVLDNMKRKLTV